MVYFLSLVMKQNLKVISLGKGKIGDDGSGGGGGVGGWRFAGFGRVLGGRGLLLVGLVGAVFVTGLGLGVGVGVAEARDNIRIVGSSTVYPFATVAAEKFGRATKFRTPIIEATGSGGGDEVVLRGGGGGVCGFYEFFAAD